MKKALLVLGALAIVWFGVVGSYSVTSHHPNDPSAEVATGLGAAPSRALATLAGPSPGLDGVPVPANAVKDQASSTSTGGIWDVPTGVGFDQLKSWYASITPQGHPLAAWQWGRYQEDPSVPNAIWCWTRSGQTVVLALGDDTPGSGIPVIWIQHNAGPGRC
jgi:hypothetical protein